MEEEKKIGSDYLVDLKVEAELELAAQSDDLTLTVNYVQLNEIVHKQMKKRAKLLETIAHRILEQIGEELPQVASAYVKIAKLNPPMGGNVERVSIAFRRDYTRI